MHNFDEFYDIKGTNFKVINCKNCGFWHVFPYPSQEQMDTFYEKNIKIN